MTREELIQQIESYTPYNEQEEHDKELILSALKEREEILLDLYLLKDSTVDFLPFR